MNLKQLSKQYPESIGIYKITSPSGKIYIGQSTNIRKRYYSYITSANLDNPSQKRLFNSFKKYGVLNHIFEIIEECDLSQLNERELHWSNYYDTLGINGLGSKMGHIGGRMSNESKQKLSMSLKGKKQLQKTIEKRREKIKGREVSEAECINKSIAKKEYFKNNEFTWGHKISEAKKGKPRKPFSEETKNKMKKPILQYDKDMNLIAEYNGTVDAAKVTGVKFDNISQCLRGKSKTAGGYIWRFK